MDGRATQASQPTEGVNVPIPINFPWWSIPTIITLAGIFWALYIVDDGGGFLSGLGNIFALIPVLVVSCIAWIIAGVLK